MIDIFLIIPVIAAAALIAYIDYETHIVQKRWILLLALCGIPAAIASWQQVSIAPNPVIEVLPGIFILALISILMCIELDGVQLLGLGGADIKVIGVLTVIFPAQIHWILLLALILGVVFSSAYLYGRNKYFDADFTQKITMLGSRVTQNGKCTVVWQPWTMPLCVPIAGSLLIMMYFWIL